MLYHRHPSRRRDGSAHAGGGQVEVRRHKRVDAGAPVQARDDADAMVNRTRRRVGDRAPRQRGVSKRKIVVGLAVKVPIVGAAALTVTVAVAVWLPPAPVTVRV